VHQVGLKDASVRSKIFFLAFDVKAVGVVKILFAADELNHMWQTKFLCDR
jgi:hypothetical protein